MTQLVGALSCCSISSIILHHKCCWCIYEAAAKIIWITYGFALWYFWRICNLLKYVLFIFLSVERFWFLQFPNIFHFLCSDMLLNLVVLLLCEKLINRGLHLSLDLTISRFHGWRRPGPRWRFLAGWSGCPRSLIDSIIFPLIIHSWSCGICGIHHLPLFYVFLFS